MKNVGPFLAFNKDWFERHQSVLLWLLNGSLTKRWFRFVLRIRKHDAGYDKIIVKLLPNCYTVFNRFIDEETVELTTDFRTHPKYAKRIYYAFKPVWWLLHFWDLLLADRFIPRWSFGFNTLTVYPDPGTGASTVDGLVRRSGVDEAFSTIRNGAGTGVDATSSGVSLEITASATTNQFQQIQRWISTFDTSSLTSQVTVSNATFSLFGTSWNNNIGTPSVNAINVSPASNNNLVSSDYSNVTLTAISTALTGGSTWSTTGYNDFALNSSGLSNINPTGISRFGAALVWDINNSFTGSWSSSVGSWVTFTSADQAGTSQDPKLVVTYATPIPVNSIPGVNIFKSFQVTGY